MRSDFNEIEERLQDFLEFEHEVTNDIWDNIESGLTLENSVGDLADFEFDVTDDIWQGIEERLTVKRPKAAIWWFPGVAASLLLTLLTWYNLDKLGLSESNTIQDALVDNSLLELKKNVNVNSVNRSSSNTPAENVANEDEASINNIDSDVINSSSNEGSAFDVGNSAKGNNNGYLANASNFSNSAARNANNQNATADDNSTSSNDLNRNARNATTTDGGQIIFIEDENAVFESKDDINLNSSIDNINNNISNNSEVTVVNDQQPSSMLPIAKESKEEIVDDAQEELPIVALNDEIVSQEIEEDEEEEEKSKKWQLIALGGVGNLVVIKETFDIGGLPPNPNDKNAPKEFEPIIIDGKEGMNSISYSMPINLSLSGQRKLSDGFAVRLGVNYTQLKNNFQLYQEEYSINLNYIAVPLTGVVTLKQWDKLKWSALLNTRSEKLVSHKFVQSPELTYYLPEQIEVNNDGFNILVGLGSELNINLTENLSLTTNIQVNRYLQNDSQREYIRAKQKLWPEVNIGLSQNF